MARKWFTRADLADSDCTPSFHENKTLTTGGGSSTVTASIPAQVMNREAFSFTTNAGVPGGEDLPDLSDFIASIDVTVADAQLSYFMRFQALDSSCNVLVDGQVNQVEAAFTGTGVQPGTAQWNPPPLADRYQFVVIVSNSNGHSGAAGTFTIESTSNSFLEIPNAPAGGGTTFFETLPATSVGAVTFTTATIFARILATLATGTVAVASLSTFVRTLAATATGIAVVSSLSTFVRTLAASAAATPDLAKKMFTTFATTTVGTVVFTPARITARVLALISTATVSLSSLNIRARALVTQAVTLPATVKFMWKTLPVTASGVASHNKFMWKTLAATAVGVAGSTTALFFQLTLAATASGLVMLDDIYTTSQAMAATSVTVGLIATVKLLGAAVTTGAVTVTRIDDITGIS